MKYTILLLTVGIILLIIPIYISQPSYNDPDPGCNGSGCHTLEDGLVSASATNLQVTITVSGTTSDVAGELVDATGLTGWRGSDEISRSKASLPRSCSGLRSVPPPWLRRITRASAPHPVWTRRWQTRELPFPTLPLCYSHHVGMHGILGDRVDFANAGVDELDLLADVIEQLTK